jgi:hypothetical protein
VTRVVSISALPAAVDARCVQCLRMNAGTTGTARYTVEYGSAASREHLCRNHLSAMLQSWDRELRGNRA